MPSRNSWYNGRDMQSNNYNPKLWVQHEDVCKLLWEHDIGHNEFFLMGPRKDLIKKITLGRTFRSKWSRQKENGVPCSKKRMSQWKKGYKVFKKWLHGWDTREHFGNIGGSGCKCGTGYIMEGT